MRGIVYGRSKKVIELEINVVPEGKCIKWILLSIMNYYNVRKQTSWLGFRTGLDCEIRLYKLSFTPEQHFSKQEIVNIMF